MTDNTSSLDAKKGRTAILRIINTLFEVLESGTCKQIAELGSIRFDDFVF